MVELLLLTDPFTLDLTNASSLSFQQLNQKINEQVYTYVSQSDVLSVTLQNCSERNSSTLAYIVVVIDPIRISEGTVKQLIKAAIEYRVYDWVFVDLYPIEVTTASTINTERSTITYHTAEATTRAAKPNTTTYSTAIPDPSTTTTSTTVKSNVTTYLSATTVPSTTTTKISENSTTTFSTDCGPLPNITNGIVTIQEGTSEGSNVTYRCSTGYGISGVATRTCVNRAWSGLEPICMKDCIQLTSPFYGIVNVSGTHYSDFATYSCHIGYRLVGDAVRLCEANGDWSGMVASCVAIENKFSTCPNDTDSRSMIWKEVLAGQRTTLPCGKNYSGFVERRCSTDGTWQAPIYNCERAAVTEINNLISKLAENATTIDIASVLQQMTTVTYPSVDVTKDFPLSSQELNSLSGSLVFVANLLANSTMTQNITDDFVTTASNLIDWSTKESWKSLLDEGGATKVIKAMDHFGEALAKLGKSQKPIVRANLAIAVQKLNASLLVFPDPQDTINFSHTKWIQESQSSIHFETQVLNATDNVAIAVMYRNMVDIIPTETSTKTKGTQQSINGPLLAFSVIPPINYTLDPPISLRFEHYQQNLTNVACVFWKFQIGSSGYWSNEGCQVKESNTTMTECQCSHLTNFAILMSPFQQADANSLPLRVVSIIGMAVSIIGLLITLILHFYLWKALRNDRTSLLMNLCIALLLSYVIFLAGVDRTESQVSCVIVAALLHYIYLVVFCVMLAEGIQLSITVLYVFATRSNAKALAITAWVLPALIVAISLGITKLDGYGNVRFCWLTIKHGVIWAFVGPALAIILANLIILMLVFRSMNRTNLYKSKKIPNKLKTSLRSLCVLVPLMGVSWILGIFYVNKDAYFMQYIFAVCNGLQGFFIFVFHCLLNKKLRKAWRTKSQRKQSLSATLRSTLRTTSKEDLEKKTSSRNIVSAGCESISDVGTHDASENDDHYKSTLDNDTGNEDKQSSHGQLRTSVSSSARPKKAFPPDMMETFDDVDTYSEKLKKYLHTDNP